MKNKCLIILFFILYCMAGKAQDSIRTKKLIDSFVKVATTLTKGEDCDNGIYLSPEGFFQLSKQVFSKVVVKNDDLVKNGTASNLTIDKDKATISGNANFKIRDNFFGNVGLGGNTSSKQLMMFKEGGYNKGFTITGGIDYKLRSSLFYNPDSCKSVTKKRRSHLSKELLVKLKGYTTFNPISAEAQKEKIYDLIYKQVTEVLSADTIMKYEKEYKSIEDSLEFYEKFLGEDVDVKELLDSTISDFEVKNAPTTGYTLWWLNANGSFSNQSYNIFDTSLSARFFNDTLKNKHYRLFTATVSGNFAWNTPRLLWYVYFGVTYQNQFGLQDFKYSSKSNELIGGGTALVKNSSIEALDVTKITTVYNEEYKSIVPQLGTFAFFGKSKAVGVEFFASLNTKIDVPDLLEHRPSGDFRLGPLFALTKAEGVISNGTIGLMLSATNWVFSKNSLGDVLGFSVRLGIPFSNIKGL